jgi:hypothetical protein
MTASNRTPRPLHARRLQRHHCCGVEQLESRRLLAQGVGVESGFLATTGAMDPTPTRHAFRLTSVTEDFDNDGRVNRQQVTITGEINRGGLALTHLPVDLAVEAVGGAASATAGLTPATNTVVSFTLSVPLSPGQNNVTFRVSRTNFGAFSIFTANADFNPSNNMGTLSPNLLTETYTVVAPDAPVLQNATGSGNVTNQLPRFRVSSVEGQGRIELRRDSSSTSASAAIVDVNGPQAFVTLTEPDTALADGQYIYSARYLTPSNVPGLESATTIVTLDRTPPAAPSPPDLQAASDTGPSNTDNVTADSSPTFDVAGIEAGATVQLFREGGTTPVATVTTATGGTVSLTDPSAPVGRHDYTARQIDVAGNPSASSTPLSVEITPPVEPGAPDLQDASDTGSSRTDNITADSSPTFDIQADAGDDLELLRDGFVVDTRTNVPGGTVTLTDLGPAPDGVRLYSVRRTDIANNTTISPSLAVTIDTIRPVAPGPPDLQADSDTPPSNTDNITADASPMFDVAGIEVGATVRLRRDGAVVAVLNNAPAGTVAVTDPGPAPDGRRSYTAQQVDVAGNESDPGAALDVIIDTTSPAAPTDLDLLTDTGESPTDNVTATVQPLFSFSGIERDATVELLRNSVPVAAQVVPGNGAVTLTDPNLANATGVFRYTVRQTDRAGNVGAESAPLTVVLDPIPPTGTARVALADQTFTGNALESTANRRPSIEVTLTDQPQGFVNTLTAALIQIDGRAPAAPVVVPQVVPANGNTARVTLTVPEDLALGFHTVTIRATDLAGNTSTDIVAPFLVLENRPASTPGSPVFTTVFDLQNLVASLSGPNVSDRLFPWNISFDRTTQTIWFVLRGQDAPVREGVTPPRERGNHVVQLDPVTGQAKVYDLSITTDNDPPNTGPHSVFFDFESHLTPRVWFAQRSAGLVSYLDVATNTIVTYNLRQMLEPMKAALGLTELEADAHAVVVDRRGVVWVSDEHDGLILELDTRVPTANGGTNVNTDQGTLTVHVMPKSFMSRLTGAQAGLVLLQDDEIGLHGLDVVADDRPNRNTQPYVYFSILGTGGVGLLIPGVLGAADRWVAWDVSEALRAEGSTATDSKGNVIPVGNPLFVTIDNNESPGTPEDDRVFFGDPGSLGRPNSAIRALYPGNAILDPNAMTSLIRTWQLPALSAAGIPSGTKPQPNQVYVDREGNTFFIDRQSGVGRLDTNSDSVPPALQTATRTLQAPILPVPPDELRAPLTVPLTPVRRPVSLLLKDGVLPRAEPFDTTMATVPAAPGRPRIAANDLVGMAGLDQYQVMGPAGTTGNRGQSTGPFRGTINAGSTVYASLTQNDQLAAVLFAETVRRPMDVVLTPDGTRMAFQVLRNGDLILTRRGPRQVVDQQFNITRTQLPGQVGPAIVGNVAATVDGRGVVHVFGKDRRGGLTEYVFDPTTARWSTQAFALSAFAAGPLASNPTAFEIDDAAKTAAAFVTTGNGHLILFRADSDTPVDLSAAAGQTPIFGEVGEVVVNGQLFAYGTDMTGKLAEYAVSPQTGTATSRLLTIPGGERNRVFQDIEAILVNGVRHILGTNGFSQLVDIQLDAAGNIAAAENVTELVKNMAAGYSPYQQPYAARVYSDVSAAVDPTTGVLFVYGTNGRDLVEFRRAPTGTWEATNLTNALNGPNDTANRVFGAPAVVILPNGDRHILLISEDGEVIEYYKLNGLSFATYNITLAQGNDPDTGSFPNILPPTPPADDFDGTVGPRAALLAFNLANLQAVGAGQIGTATDTDAFRFVAPRTGRFAIRLTALTPGLKAQLVVFNARRRRIADDRGRTGRVILLNAVAGRTYFLAIRSRNGTTGAYNVVVEPRSAARRRTATPRPVSAARLSQPKAPILPQANPGTSPLRVRLRSLPATFRPKP